MLLSEFLAELREPRLPWNVTQGGPIRCKARFVGDSFVLTPLVWVAIKAKGRVIEMGDMSRLRDVLEMNVDLLSRIWTATESAKGPNGIRSMLLKACGTEER